MESTSTIDETRFGAAVRHAWAELCRMSEFSKFDAVLKRLNTSTLLFGGYPRLIARRGDPLGARDIDIVVEISRAELAAAVEPWKVRQTRFGGMHLSVGAQRVDIWSLCDTWAFREHKVDVRCVPENLINTVFLSIDAIAYDLHTNVLYARQYAETTRRFELDIVLRDNPYPALCVLRALVFLNEYGLRASRRLRRYIQEFVRREEVFSDLVRMQATHYGFERVAPDVLQGWLMAFRGRGAQMWLFGPRAQRLRSRNKAMDDDPLVACLLEEQEIRQTALFAHSALATPGR